MKFEHSPEQDEERKSDGNMKSVWVWREGLHRTTLNTSISLTYQLYTIRSCVSIILHAIWNCELVIFYEVDKIWQRFGDGNSRETHAITDFIAEFDYNTTQRRITMGKAFVLQWTPSGWR